MRRFFLDVRLSKKHKFQYLRSQNTEVTLKKIRFGETRRVLYVSKVETKTSHNLDKNFSIICAKSKDCCCFQVQKCSAVVFQITKDMFTLNSVLKGKDRPGSRHDYVVW